MKLHRLIIGILMACAGLVPARAADEFPGTAWTERSPESQGVNSTLLDNNLASLPGPIVVIRNGFLIYKRGAWDQPMGLWSVSKSITSMICAKLNLQGRLNFDDLVPGSNLPGNPLASFRHFMTMTSDYGLTPHSPGNNYAYNNNAVHFYGGHMAQTFFGGSNPVDTLQNAFWNVIGRQDGVSFNGQWGGWDGGWSVSPRDLARIGYLVLKNGNWNGTQLLPTTFVQNLYQNQIPPHAQPNWDVPSNDPHWNETEFTQILPNNYSFGWWVVQNQYPNALAPAIGATGYMGKKITVCPDYDLVIVALPHQNSYPDHAAYLNAVINAVIPSGVMVTGDLMKWHKVTLNLNGPSTSEMGTPNPFRDYRLNITFTKGSRSLVIPGFFAGDGNAAETSATAGNKWRVHFMPDETGTWSYTVSFRQGTDIAASVDPTAGTAVAPLNGLTGTFFITETDKTGRDHRGKGLLKYVGKHQLQFVQTGEYFLKGGADSPENFLAYTDFDATTPNHTYSPHSNDWRTGDPTWMVNKGKNIIGALNYLSGKGMNSVYFLTMNVGGDGNDVWPWTAANDRLRYDVSKLDQWELVFSHMDKLGIMLHVILQERENDHLLDLGALGIERKIYHRELIARFGHHQALTWNLGEESTHNATSLRGFAQHLRDLDPYDHPIAVHHWPGTDGQMFTPLLGFAAFEGPSLQLSMEETHARTLHWVQQSATAGRPWVVPHDETTPASDGVVPDSVDPGHDAIRKNALWGNLMAGGAGVEWYFGYNYPHGDLLCEDWRSRDRMWDLTRIALDFFRTHLPYHEMRNDNALTSATNDYCLVKPGLVYAIYLPNGGTTNLNLAGTTGNFKVEWYNPRTGGALQSGTAGTMIGGGMVSIGNPPSGPTSDWVALVTPTTGLVTQSVVSLTLVNADTDQPIPGFDPMPSNVQLDLFQLPTRNLNIRANTNPTTVGSVRFGLDSNASFGIDSQVPYAMAGDSSGNYNAWTPLVGAHTVTATPTTGSNGSGTLGNPLVLQFTVVDSRPGTNNPPTIDQPARANPNPTLGLTTRLSVLGSDDGGEENLNYHWEVESAAPGIATFSLNNNNAAKNTIINFSNSGLYQLRVNIRDSSGLTTASSVEVTVQDNIQGPISGPGQSSVNPAVCVVSKGCQEFKFLGFGENTNIRIFDRQGRRITEFDINDTNGAWNLRNEDEDQVSSGMYLYTARDPKNTTNITGKIVVVK